MKSIIGGLLTFLLCTCVAQAQVPHLITYQGRVSSNGQPFSGNGQFKFALVGVNGTPVYWRNDGSGDLGEPALTVNVPVSNGLFTVVLGDTAQPGMAAIPPAIFNNAQVYLRIWFNNGVNGFVQLTPDQRITAVGYALMSDNIRDGAITMDKIAAQAIDASKLAPGTAASNLLASGRSSLVSGGVVLSAQANATNLFNEGYVRIGEAALIGESWRALPDGPPLGLLSALKRMGHVAVWTGTEMIIWGGQDKFGTYASEGGRYNPANNSWLHINTNGAPPLQDIVSAVWSGTHMIVWGNGAGARGGRYNPATDSWLPMSTSNAPSPRGLHSTVWTGTQMIIWGGSTGGFFTSSGARYNPTTDVWTPVSTTGAPAVRGGHSAIWAGTEMIVWGGYETHGCGLFCFSFTNYSDGARYNPSTDMWTPISNVSAPLARFLHSAVWSGSQMIVWGGRHGTGSFGTSSNVNSGARYTPANNTWTAITQVGAPVPRDSHVAFWTGSRMAIWGGTDGNLGTNYNNGGRYDPGNNTWTTITNSGAPPARLRFTGIWTGTEMIIWGGEETPLSSGGGPLVEIGRRYNPTSDSWTNMAPGGDPSERIGHTAIWTGTEMIVWGGNGGEYLLRTGGRLDPSKPAALSWSVVNSTGAPTARIDHTAVWTGKEMLIWGGSDGTSALNTGARYNAASNTWLPVSTNGAPAARSQHVAVWSGTEMLVWGGSAGTNYFTNGGRYNPLTDTWQPLSGVNAPLGRTEATAVWTGNEMIVWGGARVANPPPTIDFQNTGGRYNPASNTWQPTSLANAPTPRAGHRALWSGTEMIVWGGDLSGIDSGGRYRPASNTWIPLSTNGVPVARDNHTAVWDGTRMIVWGGTDGTNELASGAVYDPIPDTWKAITTSTNAPLSRERHASVWTGTEMIIHGGRRSSGIEQLLKDTSAYTPARTMYLYLKP